MAATSHAQDPPKTLAQATFPRRVLQALQNQLQIAGTELGRQLQVVLQEAELALGRQADGVRSPAASNTLLEGARLLRDRGPSLAPGVLADLEAALAQLHAPRVTRPLEELRAPSGGLSLVDDLEMDEGSVLASIAARAETRNSLALQLLGHRYGVLAGAPAFDAEHLAVGPNALCHAMRMACEGLGLGTEARLVVYRQFEKVAMAHYPTLLEALNARLAADGILPHLSFVPVRIRREAGARPAAPPARPAPAPPQAQAQAAAPIAIAGAAPPVRARSEADVEFTQLQQLLARRRQLLAKLRQRPGDERTREPLSRDEVLSALRRQRGEGKPLALAEALQALLAQGRQAHGHGVALADADSDGFELLGLFLAQLQRELRKGSVGEALVNRLRLPLLQLALRDHRFFVDAEHPARKLVDAVSLAGARWLDEDDLDPQWLGLLQRAVGTVLEDPDAGNDTFVAANHALQGGLQAISRKNEMAERRQVEAARGRERLGLARRRANDEIARLVAGRPLPRFHVILLEQAWADVLALALLRNGEDSDAWRELLADTRAIVEAAVDPDRHAEPAFVARVEDALGQVGYHAEDAAALAHQLANGRADEDDLASRTELIVQLRARARLGEERLADAAQAGGALDQAAQAARGRLAAIEEGCWIDLRDPADDSVVRRRLAWLSPRSGQALVLNRRGLRAGEETLDSLARKLADGRLALLEGDEHPAELAWRATFENLERIAGDAGEAAHG
ncbi:MAG TPA: DUF1631 family protein [Thermomonas sp.]|nr:DUF1631 family protein [Thermomonas sp.]